MKFIVDLWLDGISDDDEGKEMEEACLEYIEDNLDASGSSVHAERYYETTGKILIDAAERFRQVACPLSYSERTIKPTSCKECAAKLGPSMCTEVSAILGLCEVGAK